MPFARRRYYVAAAAAALLWLIPNWSDTMEDPADPSQSKCAYGSVNDPIKIERPAYPGGVRIIRLTNSGQFVRRCELTDALDELSWDSPLHPKEFRPPVKPGVKPRPKLVLLYVHGWKHNGDAGDPDLIAFSKLVAKLQGANAGTKQVLGIYIAWNATPSLPPLTFGPFANLTFWSKERIADRIAQSGVVTKIISAVGAMRRSTDDGSDQFVVIGHSFGARIVFSAVGQTLIYETEKGHPGFPGGVYRVTGGPVNAVVLLNPAFEAALYTSLDDVFRNEEQFDDRQLPLLLSVSSESDLATRIAFPVGQWLGFSRTVLEDTTLGNYKCYQTHVLKPVNGRDCLDPSDLSNQFGSSGLCLQRIARCNPSVVQNRNPFIVASTPDQVISGHNDIWNDKFATWLLAFLDELQKQKSATHGG